MITCQTCGMPSTQKFDPKKETRAEAEEATRNAAKVNRQGPYCHLCRMLEMSRRIARHRGWSDVTNTIELAQDQAQSHRV